MHAALAAAMHAHHGPARATFAHVKCDLSRYECGERSSKSPV
jgi:hypothetical protein